MNVYGATYYYYYYYYFEEQSFFALMQRSLKIKTVFDIYLTATGSPPLISNVVFSMLFWPCMGRRGVTERLLELLLLLYI
jgi:hypothetical protein